MNIFRVVNAVSCYLFLLLIYGHNLKVSGPSLVRGWSWNCCCKSSTTDSDDTSNSSDQAEFELNITSIQETPSIRGSDDKRSSQGASAEGGSADGRSSQGASAEGGSDKDKSDENYELTSDGASKTYKIKSGKKCKLVKVDNEEVWKYYASKFNGKYPTTIWFNNQKLYVCSEQDHSAYEKGSDGKWKSI